jgi:hypothetical protein
MTMTRITYTGTTPGADANTYVLFDTTVAFTSKNMLPMYGIKRYVVHLTHDQDGVFRWYVSDDRGVNWHAVDDGGVTVTVAAAGTTEGNWQDVLIEGFQDFKMEWVNGGAAQTPFVVDQSLDTERSDAA